MTNNNWQIEKLLNPKNEKITEGELVTGEFENLSILAVNLNKTRHHTMIYLGKTEARRTWPVNRLPGSRTMAVPASSQPAAGLSSAVVSGSANTHT